jgi:Lysine methyltransferase/Ankyrin repeats (3 copies)/Ankyrin repeat
VYYSIDALSDSIDTDETIMSEQTDAERMNTAKAAVAKSPSIISLNVPTELTTEEYRALWEQIVTDDLSEEQCGAELLEAARYNDIDLVRALLRVHPGTLYHQDAASGNTALHMAAANGHVSIIALLLHVEETLESATTTRSNSSESTATAQQPLMHRVNAAGNTALHWAASQGQAEAVRVLLLETTTAKRCGGGAGSVGIDVLQKNAAGRSILTEGFSSQNEAVISLLLEHESATEERLIQTTTNTTTSSKAEPNHASVTHAFQFGPKDEDSTKIAVHIRELAIANSDTDSILGQASPDQDTTGFGIWAASLVAAQWMAELLLLLRPTETATASPIFHENTTVLELGAGCGVPGLTVAGAGVCRAVYVTDFNPTTVSNLQHNIDLNHKSSTTTTKAAVMNWQDRSTWPTATVDVLIGSDLVYQSDMVMTLLQTVAALQPRRFLYVAGANRCGHTEFIEGMLESGRFVLTSSTPAPARYTMNPLASQDDEECFVHFHELMNSDPDAFTLYDFRWNEEN